MTTISEIESAIRKLDPASRWKLAESLGDLLWDSWDAEIEADASAGRLDHLLAEVHEEIRTGKTEPLDEVLHDS